MAQNLAVAVRSVRGSGWSLALGSLVVVWSAASAFGPSVSAGEGLGGPGGDLGGTWKVVAEDPRGGTTEWAIVSIRAGDDGPRAEVVASPPLFRGSRAYLQTSRDALVLVATNGYLDVAFKAPLTGDRPGGRIPGMLRIRHPQVPIQVTLSSRLERTEERALAPPKEPPGGDGGGAGGPSAGGVLGQLRLASEWTGPRYRALDLRLAQEAARDVPLDAQTEEWLWAAGRLAEAARRTGPPELAAEAEAKAADWRRVLSEEGSRGAAPPAPQRVEIRRAEGEDRVVLVELFTGAECGPCTAADRAFDAVAAAFRPGEAIALQYHLHIPAPDPLANPDAVARAATYRVVSTPSTFFNGRPLAGGGGPPAHALKKFNQYRRTIEGLLRGTKGASIALEARRAGDEVRIQASAELKEAAPGARARLRLALVEDDVPYEGGNGLKAHRRVVRALPGGPEGFATEGGRVEARCAVRLDRLRSDLQSYLADYPDSPESRGRFPRALPAVDLRRLSVVAFVQDEARRDVLHAVEAPIGEGSSEGRSGDPAP